MVCYLFPAKLKPLHRKKPFYKYFYCPPPLINHRWHDLSVNLCNNVIKKHRRRVLETIKLLVINNTTSCLNPVLLIKPTKEMFTPHFRQSVQWIKGLIREHNSSGGLVATQQRGQKARLWSCLQPPWVQKTGQDENQTVSKKTNEQCNPPWSSVILPNKPEVGPAKHHPNPEMECNVVHCASRRVSNFLLMNMVHFQAR